MNKSYKKIKLFTLLTFMSLFIQSCDEKIETVEIKQVADSIDTTTMGCLGSYDINPLDNKERINQVYSKGGIKDGHWIIFGLNFVKTADGKTNRAKIEEGYYRKNKKIGFWKFYNEDGTLKDSVEYKNGEIVAK